MHPPKPKLQRGWRLRFTLSSLFVVMTLAAVVLSLFFPPVTSTVVVDLQQPLALAANGCSLALSDPVVTAAAANCPDLSAVCNGNTQQWIADRASATPTPEGFVSITVRGRPLNRKHIRRVAKELAEALIAFHKEMYSSTSEEVLALLKKVERREVDEMAEATVESMPSQRAEHEQRLKALRAKIAEIEASMEGLAALRIVSESTTRDL